MKALFILIPFWALSQEPLKFEGIENVDSSITANQLYDAAQIWFVKNFKDANAVIQIEDKAGGKIVGKGFFKVYGNLNRVQSDYYLGNVTFIATVMVKDGRYKYEFSNFEHTYVKDNYYKYYNSYGTVYTTQNGFFKGYEKSWIVFYDEVNERLSEVISSLKEAMNAPAAAEQW